MQPRRGPQLGICNEAQKRLKIIGSTPQGLTCPECWQLWPIVGGARNGAAEEDWSWDLNPSAAAIWRLFLGPCILSGTTQHWASFWGPFSFGSAPFLPCGWCWEPESRTSTSFLRYGTPDWEEGEGRTVRLWVF